MVHPNIDRNYIMASTKLKQRLIFDKVTFTFPIDEDKRQSLLERINDPECYGSYNRKVYKRTGGRYKNNYQFTIHNGNTIELSLYPKNTNHNFSRVEYNPTNLGKEGRKALRTFLIKLLGIDIVKTIYFEATVTRLDLTLDVFNMVPNLYIHKNRVHQSEIFRVEGSNNIETQILGSDHSNCRVTLYDKHLEQGQQKGKDDNYQRIEVRLRKLNCTMAALSDDLLVEIEALNFFHADFLTDGRFTKKFKREAHAQGLNFALMALTDDNKRRRYRRYLEDYRAYPIALDDLDFEKAHRRALSSLLHPDLRGQVNHSIAA
jgi:hypothetical protein